MEINETFYLSQNEIKEALATVKGNAKILLNYPLILLHLTDRLQQEFEF